MAVRSIRGAVDVAENSRAAILEAGERMLVEIVQANNIEADDVVAAFFSSTRDLDAVAPAAAARSLGWRHIALHCFQEMKVQQGLPMCLRVTVLINSDKRQEAMVHRYLGSAARLRPDLA